MNTPLVSVIIPCLNEKDTLENCIFSVINQKFPQGEFEIIVVDGMSTDGTTEILGRLKKTYPNIKILKNENRYTPFALNLGIKESKGKYIIILSAHSIIPNDFVLKLILSSKKLNTDIVGAVSFTEVRNKNPRSCAIAKVLSSKFGVGNSYFRIGVKKIKEVDTVAFGCYKRDIFDKVGLFDVRLKRNQDIELNRRIKKGKGRIFLIPDLFYKYFARETFIEVSKNNFGNGLWNVLTIYLTKKINSLNIRHFVPFLFLLLLIIPLLLMILNTLWGLLALFFVMFYLIAITVISLRLTDQTTNIYFIMWAFLVLHISYGFGSLIGVFRIDMLIKNKK